MDFLKPFQLFSFQEMIFKAACILEVAVHSKGYHPKYSTYNTFFYFI
jgi:hypothetical protein